VKESDKDCYFITISDIHHGAIPAERMSEEMNAEGGFIDTIAECIDDPKFIGVVFTGDYFETHLDMNDSRSKIATSLFFAVFEMIKQFNKVMIALRGTYSHEYSQLDHFLALENTYDKFRVINTVEAIQFGPFKALCIPEEYMDDQEAYYKKAFSKKYDIIFGHGLFTYNAFDANDSERPMAKMPLFDENKLMQIANLIIFGHVHSHSNFKGKIWYNGSYTRLCHGEEDPKGFLRIDIDSKNSKNFSVTLIENKLAPIYRTYQIQNILKASDKTVESMIQRIEKVKESCAFLKIKVAPNFVTTHSAELEMMKTYFQCKPDIVIDCSLLSLRNKENVYSDTVQFDENGDQVEVVEQVRDTKYDFIYQESSLPEKVLEFIHSKHENVPCAIDLDCIREAISQSDVDEV
jgi:hypothetical protein